MNCGRLLKNASSFSRNCANLAAVRKPKIILSLRCNATLAGQEIGLNKGSINSGAALNSEDGVSPDFVNRNPRNLEKMCLAYKPQGYILEYPSRNYWNKIVFEKSGRNTTAYVEHYTGEKTVMASTTEWAIKKQLFSATNVSAAQNIGLILGQRCLESGILHVRVNFSQQELNCERVKAFLSGLEEGGLSLEEPRNVIHLRPWD